MRNLLIKKGYKELTKVYFFNDNRGGFYCYEKVLKNN